MTLVFDAATSAVGVTSDPTDISHVPVTSVPPSAVVVLIAHATVSTDIVVSVTYGGRTMDRVRQNTDTTTEQGRSYVYFLGSDIPPGNQTASIDRTEATTQILASCLTFTGVGDSYVVSHGGVNDNLVNPSFTHVQSGLTCMSVGAFMSGLAAVASITENASQTQITSFDYTNQVCVLSRLTTAQSADYAFGYTAAVDDVAFSTVAFTDAWIGPSILTDPVSTANDAAAATTTQTVSAYPCAQGPNRRLVVGVVWDDTGLTATNVSTVTYNGISLARVTDGTTTANQQSDSTNQTGAEVWELKEASLPPANGAYDVVVTLSQTVDVLQTHVVMLANCEQSTNVDKVTKASDVDGGSTTTMSHTPVTANNFTYDLIGLSGAVVNPNRPDNHHMRILDRACTASSGDGGQAVAYRIQGTAALETLAWTLATTVVRLPHVAVSYKPVAVTKGIPVPRQKRSRHAGNLDFDAWSMVGWA